MSIIPKLRISPLPYEHETIVEAFRANQLVTGPHIELFEKGLASTFNYKFANTTSSGFAALFLALKALKLVKAKVVVPKVSTCHAMSNAVLANDFEVVFCDIDPDHLSLSLASLNDLFQHTKIDAIIAPSHFGIPAPIETYKQFGVPVIEDACQAFFTRTSIASSADMMVLSFYPTKQFNCIEGGVILHNSPEKDEIIEDLKYYDHQTHFNGQSRYNLRMPNLHAAFGCLLLEDIEERYIKLDQLRAHYCLGIENKDLLIKSQCKSGVVPWRFLIKSEKEDLFENLRKSEIQTSQELAFLQVGSQLNDTPFWIKTYQSIPFFDAMTKEEQNHVINELNGAKI